MLVKNKIIKIAVCFIILISMLYFLPIPLRINITLEGSQLADTESSVNLSIKGWYLIYLFRSDRLNGKLIIAPYKFEKSNKAVYKFLGPIFHNTNIQCSTLTRYSEAENCYIGGSMFFTKDFKNTMVIENENIDSIYIASAKTPYEPNQIFDYFKDYIHVKTNDLFDLTKD